MLWVHFGRAWKSSAAMVRKVLLHGSAEKLIWGEKNMRAAATVEETLCRQLKA